MLYFLVISAMSVLGGWYAYLLRRDEVRRQQWRQECRAVWIKH